MKRLAKMSAIMKKLGYGLGVLILLYGAAFAENETAILNFVVVKDYNGKPIRNAAVVLHPIKRDGTQSKGGLELKADAEGKASYDGVPYGKLRIQVLAPGFQTFGEDFDVNQATMEITVKMKRPQEQFSVYKDKEKPSEAKTEDAPKDEKPQ